MTAFPSFTTMRVHYFQHVPFEGLGSIASWLTVSGATVACTRFFDNATLPDIEGFDLLVVVGGPMSVNNEAKFPWLIDEKAFIRRAIEGGKAVVGICLGAQLIASALGARVYPNKEKEIGWFPIFSTGASTQHFHFCFPPAATVFHWHGETFDLPPGAAPLARSAGCENQAFQLGKRVIGMQFHLETTPESARDLVTQCRNELEPSPYVQSEQTILTADAPRYEFIHSLMNNVLDFVTGNIPPGG